jgi:phosphatidylserine/phosphatidylglycerophosphate/cardiolipin synthase-like enzyme
VGSAGDVVFAPSGWHRALEDRIVSEIRAAKAELIVAMYTFTSYPVAQALRDAELRGVKVSVLLDGHQYWLSQGTVWPIVKAGGRVKVVRVSGSGILAEKFHHKYAVIDGKTVLVGSYNWSPNQDRYGYDNLVVLRDAALAQSYIRDFAATWSSPEAN